MSVMVINPETYGRIAKMLVSPGRVYEDLSRAVYTYRDQLISRGQFGGKDDEDTKMRFIVSWMERVYVANQMAFIYNYRDEEQTISFLEESHLKFQPMGMKALYEELEGIEYNLYTGAGRMFISEEDMTRLQNLKALVAKELIRGAPKMNIPECRNEADLVFNNMD